jgi:methanethiol S-methyltransferase
MRNPFPFLFTVAVYAAFWIWLACFILLVGDFGIVKSVGFPQSALPSMPSTVINLGLIGLFGLQYSTMARPWFKRAGFRHAPDIERGLHVLVSVLMLCLLMALWQPMGGTLWSVQDTLPRPFPYALFAMGWLIILLANIEIDRWRFFGLRQAGNALRALQAGGPVFREQGRYARIRHPILNMLSTGASKAADTGDRR